MECLCRDLTNCAIIWTSVDQKYFISVDRVFMLVLSARFNFVDGLFNQNLNVDLDINECQISNGGCEHQCKNTNGSYICECNKGFSLDGNGKTCTGKFENKIDVEVLLWKKYECRTVERKPLSKVEENALESRPTTCSENVRLGFSRQSIERC